MSVEDLLADVDARARLHGMRLFPYQRDGVRFLHGRRAALLDDDMGLGKTVQAVCAAARGDPVIAFCPSAMKTKWAKTFRLWRPGFEARVMTAKSDFRWPMPSEFLSANYEILPPARAEVDRLLLDLGDRAGISRPDRAAWRDPTIRAAYQRQVERSGIAAKEPHLWKKLRQLMVERARVFIPHAGTTLIIDEAHRAKNREAAVTARVRDLATLVLAHEGKVWTLTGTPMDNKLDELWTVLQANQLGVEAFGSEGQFKIDAARPGVLAQKLKTVSLRRMRDDVMPDLPPIIRESIDVPLDPNTARLADEMVAALRAAGVNIETATLDAILTATMKKIPREMVSRLRAALAAAKIPVLADLVADLEEQKIATVVFSSHRAPLDFLALRDGWARISGEESQAEKDSAQERFQAGELKGVAVGHRAGGEGIDLFYAWRWIEVDLPWTPGKLWQADARLRRYGQKAKSLLGTRLVADHVLERRVFKLLEEKAKLFEEHINASAVRGEA